MRLLKYLLVVILLQTFLFGAGRLHGPIWNTFSNIEIENVLSEKWKDKTYVLSAIKYSSKALKYADNKFKIDREVVLKAVGYFGDSILYADKKFRDDKKVMLTAISNQGYENYAYCGKQDYSLRHKAAERNGLLFKIASPRLRNDKEVILTAINANPLVIQYVPKILKNNIEIIKVALKQYDKNGCYSFGLNTRDINIFEYIDKKFSKDRTLIEDISVSGCLLKHMDISLQDDKVFIMKLLKKDPRLFYYLSDKNKNVKEFALIAVTYKVVYFYHLGEKLQKDKDILSIYKEQK